MKNKLKFLGLLGLAAGLSFVLVLASCGGSSDSNSTGGTGGGGGGGGNGCLVASSTDGEFTLTNIAAKYSGKFVILYGLLTTDDFKQFELYGFSEVNSDNYLKGVKITGGTVKIPVYKSDLWGSGSGCTYSSFSDTVKLNGQLKVYLIDNDEFQEYTDKKLILLAGPFNFNNGKSSVDCTGLEFGDLY